MSFPATEPRCDEHMDATCWNCQGFGRLPCASHDSVDPDCEACQATGCETCEGKGSGSWCYHPDCEACSEADAYWKEYSRREDRWKEERAGII